MILMTSSNVYTPQTCFPSRLLSLCRQLVYLLRILILKKLISQDLFPSDKAQEGTAKVLASASCQVSCLAVDIRLTPQHSSNTSLLLPLCPCLTPETVALPQCSQRPWDGSFHCLGISLKVGAFRHWSSACKGGCLQLLRIVWVFNEYSIRCV